MRRAALLYLLIPFIVLAQTTSHTQTDWSGGAGESGPVSAWADRFDNSDDIDFSTSGELILSTEPLANPAQTFIDVNFSGVNFVIASDVNGDGNLDVVGAAAGDNQIAWWENGGAGTSWTKHIVATNIMNASCVDAGDLDGDGDVDIVATSQSGHRVYWFENLAGDGTTWSETIINNSFTGARSIHLANLGGDAALDIVATAETGNRVTWWQNVGNGSSWTMEDITATLTGARTVYTGDLDGDSDLDVVAGGYNADQVIWYENGASWAAHTIDGSFDGPYSVYVANMDGDGDVDVLGAAYDGRLLVWWENDGGGGTWTETTVSSGAMFTSVAAKDIDMDGDTDIASANVFTSPPAPPVSPSVDWWENDDGSGNNFTEHGFDPIYVPTPLSVAIDDIDGDGKNDLLASSNFDNDVFWFKIYGYAGTGELESAILDVGTQEEDWGEIIWDVELPDSSTHFAAQVRSSNDSSNMGSWSAYIIDSGTDISGFANNTDRYVQYRLTLDTDSGAFTPTFREITIQSLVIAPEATSAVAADTSGGENGIQTGDTVAITFNEEMTPVSINSGNIDSYLPLSNGHTWLSGGGNLQDSSWSSGNTVLTITLSASGGEPTVAVGDSIGFSNDIVDTLGTPATGSVTITGTFGNEQDPPEATVAAANDTSQGGAGIQTGDTVAIVFDEEMTPTQVDASNIDTHLALSGGHTWLSGFNSLEGSEWQNGNTRLVITLNTNGGVPTVAVGDTIDFSSNIGDQYGNPVSGTIDITGSFDEYTEPPTITHTPITSTPINESLAILATITGSVVEARVYYRRGGESSFEYSSMNNGSGNEYSGQIPADSITGRGLEYYLWASDGTYDGTFPIEGGDSPITTRVTYDGDGISTGHSQHSGRSVSDYRLFSVPTDYGSGGAAADAVLGDDLGSYDLKYWRLGRYQGGQVVEYTQGNMDNFAPGRAFWLIVGESGKPLDSGAGQSSDTSTAYPVELNPGWNMIATPFAFSVSWDDITNLNANSGIIGDLQNPVSWDGEYNYDATRLDHWSGYWLYYDGSSAATLHIPPTAIGGSSRMPFNNSSWLDDYSDYYVPIYKITSLLPATSAQFFEPPLIHEVETVAYTSRSVSNSLEANSISLTSPRSSSPIMQSNHQRNEVVTGHQSEAARYTSSLLSTMPAEEWTLELRLDSAGMSDSWNQIGVNATASNYWDVNELREPPLLAGATNLWFEHVDWPTDCDEYATDFRAGIGEGASWEFIVQPMGDETEALLSWSWVKDLPSRYDVILIDHAIGRTVNLLANNDYEINLLPGEVNRQLEILVGTDDWLDGASPEPARKTVLEQSYPNPARQQLTIEFDLANNGPVELKVYDLAGRLITTLLDEQVAAGSRAINWNLCEQSGRVATSGIYLYMLRTNEGTLTRRLVISR